MDALVEARGLRVSEVQSALLMLELDGRLEFDGGDRYTPSASCA